MSVESKYTERGQKEHNVLKGIRSHLTAVDRLNKVVGGYDGNLSSVVEKFGLDRTPEDIRQEMTELAKTPNWPNALLTDPKLLVEATELTMLLISKTKKNERINDEDSMNFMTSVDNVFRPDNFDERDIIVQATRKIAVEMLAKKYNDAAGKLKLEITEDDDTDKTKIGRSGKEVKELLDRNNQDELARLLLETKIKNIENEYKNIKSEKEEGPNPFSIETPTPERSWKGMRVKRLAIAGTSLLAASALSAYAASEIFPLIMASPEKFAPILQILQRISEFPRDPYKLLALASTVAVVDLLLLRHNRQQREKESDPSIRSEISEEPDITEITSKIKTIFGKGISLKKFENEDTAEVEEQLKERAKNWDDTRRGITRLLFAADSDRLTVFDTYEDKTSGFYFERLNGKIREKAFLIVESEMNPTEMLDRLKAFASQKDNTFIVELMNEVFVNNKSNKKPAIFSSVIPPFIEN